MLRVEMLEERRVQRAQNVADLLQSHIVFAVANEVVEKNAKQLTLRTICGDSIIEQRLRPNVVFRRRIYLMQHRKEMNCEGKHIRGREQNKILTRFDLNQVVGVRSIRSSPNVTSIINNHLKRNAQSLFAKKLQHIFRARRVVCRLETID
jgi:hypothetical protein